MPAGVFNMRQMPVVVSSCLYPYLYEHPSRHSHYAQRLSRGGLEQMCRAACHPDGGNLRPSPDLRGRKKALLSDVWGAIYPADNVTAVSRASMVAKTIIQPHGPAGT